MRDFDNAGRQKKPEPPCYHIFTRDEIGGLRDKGWKPAMQTIAGHSPLYFEDLLVPQDAIVDGQPKGAVSFTKGLIVANNTRDPKNFGYQSLMMDLTTVQAELQRQTIPKPTP